MSGQGVRDGDLLQGIGSHSYRGWPDRRSAVSGLETQKEQMVQFKSTGRKELMSKLKAVSENEFLPTWRKVSFLKENFLYSSFNLLKKAHPH